MQQNAMQRNRKKKKLSFVGIGVSGRRDVSEKHEELLWRKSTKKNRS